MHYKFLVVEGNIGVGKTSLTSMLAKVYQAHLCLEYYEKNPFQPKFYKESEKHAFPLELVFMAERYHQLKNQKEQDLFRPITNADYFFVKSKLFAQNNLQKDEQQLLEESKSDIGWGSQIRSYVLDQSRIKDLRTNVESGNISAILDGDIDIFIKASLTQGVQMTDSNTAGQATIKWQVKRNLAGLTTEIKAK